MSSAFSPKAAKSIRKFCLLCQGGSSQAIASCEDSHCHIYPLRLCTLEPLAADIRPLRHVRRYCLECAETRQDVRDCIAKDCPLWSYRFGVAPTTFKRVISRLRHKKQTLLLPL